MHYAVSKQTAVEIIYSRVNSEKNIWAWLHRKIFLMESVVIIAKNYLNKEELKDLEGIVSVFLEIAENRGEDIFQWWWKTGHLE